MFSLSIESTTPPNPFLLFFLTIVILVTIYLLIVVVETAVFQFMRWGDLRACIKTAAQVNVLSFILGLILMAFIPKPNIWQLIVYSGIATTTEALLLNYLRPGSMKSNWSASFLANGASCLLLILPPFLWRG